MSHTIPSSVSGQEEMQIFSSSILLSEHLLHEGQMEIVRHELRKGMDLFQKACELNPNNPKLYFEQGLSLFEYGCEEGKEKTLLIATKKFKMAVSLMPEYFQAWHLWGLALYHLGQSTQEHHYFLESEEKLQKALALSNTAGLDQQADLLWDYGNTKTAVALHSGEALDWQISLDAFQKAAATQNHLPAEFWNQYGFCCLNLAQCINDVRMCVKSIHCFKHAISSSADSFEGWNNLSKALEALYGYTHDEDHFSQASECFSSASQLRPFDAEICLNWAKLACLSGKQTRDIKKLRLAIEKCKKAHACNPSSPHILALWGESLSYLGEQLERVELIQEGENKLSQAIDLESNDPAIWESFGHHFNCLGRYFADIDYHYQAIEKFQTGLSLNRSCSSLWYAIACTYSHLGHSEQDTDSLQKATRFFAKAVDLKPCNSYFRVEYARALSKLGELIHDEKILEQSLAEFERALSIQKNAVYLHPDWLFYYGCTLDLYGDFHEEASYYHKAIEVFSHVLMIDPDFPHIHHHLALAFSHLGELQGEIDLFYRSLHYFKLASKHEEDNDQVLLDLGIALINIAQYTSDAMEADQCYRDAEVKFTTAAKNGNLQAYYHLACLYSLLSEHEKSLSLLFKAETYDALPSVEEMIQDDWLDLVRNCDEFKELIGRLEKKSNLHER